jgi:hypothetical protein
VPRWLVGAFLRVAMAIMVASISRPRTRNTLRRRFGGSEGILDRTFVPGVTGKHAKLRQDASRRDGIAGDGCADTERFAEPVVARGAQVKVVRNGWDHEAPVGTRAAKPFNRPQPIRRGMLEVGTMRQR